MEGRSSVGGSHRIGGRLPLSESGCMNEKGEKERVKRRREKRMTEKQGMVHRTAKNRYTINSDPPNWVKASQHQNTRYIPRSVARRRLTLRDSDGRNNDGLAREGGAFRGRR